MPMSASERERVQRAAELLRSAESEVRILRTVDWAPSVKQGFFARGARELPEVSYPHFDPAEVHARLAEARKCIGTGTAVEDWLHRAADAIASSAELLGATATPRFLEHGARLYGVPTEERGGASPLELARAFDRLYTEVAGIDLGAPPPACHLAAGVAQSLDEACRAAFGSEAPEVLVVDKLSANALAGPRRIQVRRDACFTDRDVHQLIQHEAYVHVCTSLNGRHQTALPVLAASHAGTTRTQEGLAVFSELIAGVLEPERLRRLADRVIAIQMSIEGADFLEVYRYFLERTGEADQAFESTRRVFRGGVLTGGAPFTKDAVYLDGLLRVTNCLRAIVSMGRLDCLWLLFCGKLDLEDLPALAHLVELELCAPPRYLPPWVRDRRFLVTFLTYSAFLDRVRLDVHTEHYQHLLSDSPRLSGFEAPGD